MQRTRLNTVLTLGSARLTRFFGNPWRRISLILLGLLFGFFIGAALSTTAGQDAQWDVVSAALILLFCEGVSYWIYRRWGREQGQLGLWGELLNSFKLGVMYSLFLEAFKLGS
ncbi:MAG: DUF565 domain-containing protein [Cyanobacteriota bacterium]|jgi:hypothetical protein